jgi:polysaccharide export outer membrane protein
MSLSPFAKLVERMTGARASAAALCCLLGLMLAGGGCRAIDLGSPSLQSKVPPEMETPRELSMVSLPAYRIKPPDVVRLEIYRLVPRQPYRIDAFDVLMIRAVGTPRELPIDNYYVVDEQGMVTLGPAYGTARVWGLTVDQAAAVIQNSLRQVLAYPAVTVELARSAAIEQLAGEYVLLPDGTITLHKQGSVHLAGKTIAEAQAAIQERLALEYDAPLVGLDVVGYNSDGYTVIVATTNEGEVIKRFPSTGNETVLDALGQIETLSPVSSKTMWVARAAPGKVGCEQILPVDWDGIARGGETETNYQLLPGDRLFIVDDNLVAANDFINRASAPMQRLMSLGYLGMSTIRSMQLMGRGYNQNIYR